MTLTQRRAREVDPSRPGDKGISIRISSARNLTDNLATEPGIKYTCDACKLAAHRAPGPIDALGHVDITHSVRIKCAHKECDEIDLCVHCFMEGKELHNHEAWHAYKVVVCHSHEKKGLH
jgi:transcriptional adapter 2-alpha